MTSVGQVLRWLDEASALERRTTAAVVVAVVALLTASLVPAPTEVADAPPAASAAPGMDDGPATTPGVVVAGGDADGTSGVTTPSVAGPPLPGAVSTVPEASAGERTGGGAAPTGPLTATDRGVSADSIKLGFGMADWALAADLGVVPGIRGDASEVVDALVDYANERGGVLGRRIEAVKVTTSFIDPAQQRQKCVELTETEKVFTVIDSFAFSVETSTACITAEHETLLLSGFPGTSENARLGFPYHVSLYKDDNRKMKDLVAAATSAGFFDPSNGFERLGIFSEACTPSMLDAPTDGLFAHLRAAGITEWTDFRFDCAESGAGNGGSAEAVLKFKQDGVTHVLVAVHPPLLRDFLHAANGSRFFPEYFAGDYFNIIMGGLVDEYEPNGFDGALAVTQTYAGEGEVGKPLAPLAQKCSDIVTEHGLEPVEATPPDYLGDDIEVLQLCENFLLFLQVATAAGPNLTRATWVDALSRVGEFRGASTDLARFDRPGKMNGGDSTKLVQWHRDCRCWRQLTEFGPAAG